MNLLLKTLSARVTDTPLPFPPRLALNISKEIVGDFTDRAGFEIALFPVKECSCEDEDCEDCGGQFPPRTADLLLTSLSVPTDQAYDDADDLCDQPVTQKRPGSW